MSPSCCIRQATNAVSCRHGKVTASEKYADYKLITKDKRSGCKDYFADHRIALFSDEARTIHGVQKDFMVKPGSFPPGPFPHLTQEEQHLTPSMLGLSRSEPITSSGLPDLTVLVSQLQTRGSKEFEHAPLRKCDVSVSVRLAAAEWTKDV